MEAIRLLTADEAAKSNAGNFSVKITVEFGTGILGENTQLTPEKFVELAREELSTNPNAPYSQYLRFLCDNYEKFGLNLDTSSNKVMDGFERCGSCQMQLGTGRIWYSGIGPTCVPCV